MYFCKEGTVCTVNLCRFVNTEAFKTSGKGPSFRTYHQIQFTVWNFTSFPYNKTKTPTQENGKEQTYSSENDFAKIPTLKNGFPQT